jgi:hypothetical protein
VADTAKLDVNKDVVGAGVATFEVKRNERCSSRMSGVAVRGNHFR